MATIIKRSVKGSELTSAEVDQNFTNLNDGKPDYEAGDWSPTITDGTNSATLSVSNARYAKVGEIVFITGYFVLSSLGSTSGGVRLGGLPFAVSSSVRRRGSFAMGRGTSLSITAGTTVGGYFANSADFIRLTLWDTAAGFTDLQASELTADGSLWFTANYFTDA